MNYYHHLIQSIGSNSATALTWPEAPCKDAMLFSRRQASTILSFKLDMACLEMDGVWLMYIYYHLLDRSIYLTKII